MTRTITVNVGPLLEKILEGYGVSVAETDKLPRTIFRVPGSDGMIFEERNLLLAKTEARRAAENPAYFGSDIFVYHSTATFQGKELGHPSSRGDLREIIRHIAGHVIGYHPIIGFMRVGADGAVSKPRFGSLHPPIDISVRKLSRVEIDTWLAGIPDDKVAESGPGGRPLAQGEFSKLVESVKCDQNLYNSLMTAFIDKWGIYK
ncbi:MAG: hypothetical protein HGA31_04190 [Candidatus Moranbacteria bacterium]|nr:hypothetical protein [Candidatus Moranbacteria bacterium]